MRSIHLPCFQAARTPIGTAMVTASSRVRIIKDSVGSIRCWIMVVTGRLVKIDTPMSPFRMFQTHSPKRIRKGRSSPSEARMRSTSCGVAWSPAITAAGSPGAMYNSEKTKSATRAITGMVARTRRIT